MMLIYDRSCYSLYQELKRTIDVFSLAIGTLEIVIDYNSGELLYVEGFFPLIKAKHQFILIPKYKESKFFFRINTRKKITKSMVYDYFCMFPNGGKFFNLGNLVYDELNGTIKYGIDNPNNNSFMLNKNLVVSANNKNELTCLYIFPDKFV